MGALTHNGEVMQGLPADASQINFDKTGTDLNSTQTENAIKEVNTKVNTNTADITQLKSGLMSMDRVISFPFTMPSDASSKAIGDNIHIDLSANVPDTAYIIGVSVDAYAQKRTLIGEFFGQVGFKSNHLYLIDVLKAIPSGYNGISGYLIVAIPHS